MKNLKITSVFGSVSGSVFALIVKVAFVAIFSVSVTQANAQVTTPVIIPSTCTAPSPLVSFEGTPSLKLIYDSSQREGLLSSSFTISIDGANTGIYLLDFASVTYANQTRAGANVERVSKISPIGFASTTKDIYGQTMYVVAPGQKIQFSVDGSTNPLQMFAGNYIARVRSLYANFPNQNCGTSIEVPHNQSAFQYVAGEISPYITGFGSTGPFTAGLGMTVIGQRLTSNVYIDNVLLTTGVKGDDKNIGFMLPSSLADGWHSLFVRDTKTGDSNNISFQVASVLPGNDAVAKVTSSRLELMYDFSTKESLLKGSYTVSVQGGSNGVYVYRLGGGYGFYNQKDIISQANSQSDLGLTPVTPATSVVDKWGQTMYFIPAGKTIAFNGIRTIDPKQMFAGLYYGHLVSVWANTRSGDTEDSLSTSFNLELKDNNRTRPQTIAGERSPYITNVSGPVKPGNVVTITGERFNGASLFIDGATTATPIMRNRDNKTVYFIAPKLSNGQHYVTLSNKETGLSNRGYFTITDGTITVPTEVGTLSTSPSTPPARTVVANSGANNDEADGVTAVIVRFVSTENGYIQTLTANFSVPNNATTAYLYDGSTQIASANISNGVASFTNIDAAVSANAIKEYVIKVDIRHATANGLTFFSTVSAKGIVFTNTKGAPLAVSGVAQGNSMTVTNSAGNASVYPGFNIAFSKTSYAANEKVVAKLSRGDGLTAPYYLDVYVFGPNGAIPKYSLAKNFPTAQNTEVTFQLDQLPAIYTGNGPGYYILLVCDGGKECIGGQNTNANGFFVTDPVTQTPSIAVTNPQRGDVFDNGPTQNIPIGWKLSNSDASFFYARLENLALKDYGYVVADNISGPSNGAMFQASDKILDTFTQLSGKTRAELQNGYYVSVYAMKSTSAGNTFITSGKSGVFSIPPATIQTPTTSLPPVITSVTAPTSLLVGETGTWTINGTDPQLGTLGYVIDWGDNVCAAGTRCAPIVVSQTAPVSPKTVTGTTVGSKPAVQSATFSHAFNNPGTYTVNIVVQNVSGLTAQKSTVINVVVPTKDPIRSISTSTRQTSSVWDAIKEAMGF